MTTAAPAGPLLTLDTLEPKRPFLTIDGEPYDLAVIGDFDLLERARLSRLMDEATALQAEAAKDTTKRAFDELSEAQAKRVKKILDEAVAMVVRAPAAVLARLGTPQQLAVLAAFTPTLQTGGRSGPGTKSRSTSARSSRASRPSTAPVPG